MPCFYCGKQISLVRRLADADFCCEDHRNKYHDLTRMALTRLVETRDHLAAATPKRRRPHGPAAVEEPQERLPPQAELLDERVTAVPVAAQLSLIGLSAPLAVQIRLPGAPPTSLQSGFPTEPPRPYRAPVPMRAVEPRRIASARGGAFLRSSPGRGRWIRGLGYPSAVSRCGFSEQPPAPIWEAEAAKSVGCAPVSFDARQPASRVLQPAPKFVPSAGRVFHGQFLDFPARLACEPAAAGPVPAPAAHPLGDGATRLGSPVWAPYSAGLEAAVAPCRIPPPTGLLSTFVAEPRLPSRAPARLPEATTSAPAMFEPRLPEVAHPLGLPSASAFKEGAPPVRGLTAGGTRAAGAMLLPSPVAALPLRDHVPVAKLGQGIWGALGLLTLAPPRGASLRVEGWRVSPGLTRVESQPLAGWRLATVGFEPGRTEEAAPPGATEVFPLVAPELLSLRPTFKVATHAFSRPAASLPPSAPPFLLRERLPAAPEISLLAGLSISSLAGAPGLEHVPARARAAAVPKVPIPEFGVAPRLVAGYRVGMEPPLPVEEPASAASGPGWAALQSGRDVSVHPSLATRLQPLVEPARGAAPPAANDLLLVGVPEARGSGASPASGPAPQWQTQVAGLQRMDLHLQAQPLGFAPLADMGAPGITDAGARPGPRVVPPPVFPIGRPLYVGWAAMRLRRALGSGGPVVLGLGEACPGLPGLRETPAPGFRIAAWAFAHAPGIPRSAALAGAPLLPAHGAQAADRVCWYARGLDRTLIRPLASVPPSWTVGLAAGPLALSAAAAAKLTEVAPATAGSTPRLALVEAYGPFPASRQVLPEAAVAQALPAPVTWEAAPAAGLPEPPIQEPATLPHCFDWARPSRASGAVGTEAGEAHAPMAHLLNAWQRGMAEVRDLSVRLPRDRKAVEAAAAGRLGSASPVLMALAPQGAVCRPPETLGWQALQPSWACKPAVRHRLAPVRWTSADLWPVRWPGPPRCAPVRSCEAPASLRRPAVERPRLAAVAERGCLGWALPAQAATPSERDCPAACVARTDASVATGSPPRTALPRGSFTAVWGRLQAAPPHVQGGRGEDVRMTLRRPPEQILGLSGLGMPATPGIAACSFDLFWPCTALVDPVSRDQAHALRNQPKVAPIEPSMIVQAHPCVPIPHRFEPLPLETGFSLGRLFRRMPGLMLVHLISLVVLVLVGVVLWQTGAAAALRDRVRQRAAISLGEDFSSGMRRWTDGAPGWVRSPAGFMQVGSLALWNPSVRLANYRVEFMGEIERQSLAWVFRARDTGNYYAMKIAVLRPGPLPAMALERFEIVDGKPGRRTQVPLRVMLHNNAPFRVQVRISATEFTTFINGQMVDYWSDSRFPSGGVGFFNEPGAQARLYWVKVAHQDDLVGKLCAYLAPSSVDSNDGS